MNRAVAMVLSVAALTLLVATGCQRSTEVTNPKAEFKDKGPASIQPAGAPGTKSPKKGPAPGSQ
jgi:hypothetical protein